MDCLGAGLGGLVVVESSGGVVCADAVSVVEDGGI